VDPNNNPVTVVNALVNFGWEYVWHCHLLGHEENDMMRPILFTFTSALPDAPVLTSDVSGSTVAAPQVSLHWSDATPPATNLGNPKNEIGFRIERSTGAGSPDFSVIATSLANQTGFTDTTVVSGSTYNYRVTAFNEAGASTSNVEVQVP
jgi:fibronectin type 3 domain-containing protein